MTRARHCRAPGFTLTELVVSVSVMAILMGGIGSAMVLATRAIPDGNSALDDVVNGYHASEQISGELYGAQSFTVRTRTSVEFTVADRDNDASPETIRYEWSGTPGDALTRKYNSDPVADVVSDVYEFALTYGLTTLSETTREVTTTWTEDAAVAAFTSWVDPPGINQPHLINATCWESEYFEITPLAGATELKFTGAEVVLRRGTTIPGAILVGIHRSKADGSYEPAATPIGTAAAIDGGSLELDSRWVPVSFADVTVTDLARTDYCLVVKGTGSTLAYLRYLYAKTAPANGMFQRWTTDSGVSWEPRSNLINQQDLEFYVYGSFGTTGEQDVTVDRYFLTSTSIALRVGSDSSTRVDTGTQILNVLEVAGP